MPFLWFKWRPQSRIKNRQHYSRPPLILKSKQTKKKTIAGRNPSLFAVGFLLQRRGGGDRNLTGRANQNAGEVLPHTNRGGETSRGDHVDCPCPTSPPSGAVILEKFFAAAVRTAAVVVPSGGGKYRRGVLRPSWIKLSGRHKVAIFLYITTKHTAGLGLWPGSKKAGQGQPGSSKTGHFHGPVVTRVRNFEPGLTRVGPNLTRKWPEFDPNFFIIY